MQENFPPAATGALRMQLSLTEPDTLFENLLQDLPAETSHSHIPPDYVAECLSTQRKPPEVRICRLRNQLAAGTLPPSPSTPH